MRGFVKATILVAVAAVAAPAGAKEDTIWFPDVKHYGQVGNWHVFHGDEYNNQCVMGQARNENEAAAIVDDDPLPLIGLDATIDEAEIIVPLTGEKVAARLPGSRQRLYLVNTDAKGGITYWNRRWEIETASLVERNGSDYLVHTIYDPEFLTDLEGADALAIADELTIFGFLTLDGIRPAMKLLRKCAADKRAMVDMD